MAVTTYADLIAVNGQDDSQEPWSAADDCETIEVGGEDLLVRTADDRIVRWTNRDREWADVDGPHFSPAELLAEVHSRAYLGTAAVIRLAHWLVECEASSADTVLSALADLVEDEG